MPRAKRDPAGTITVNARIPLHLKERAEADAKSKGQTLQAWVTQAMAEALDRAAITPQEAINLADAAQRLRAYTEAQRAAGNDTAADTAVVNSVQLLATIVQRVVRLQS